LSGQFQASARQALKSGASLFTQAVLWKLLRLTALAA
jgi:hypothetical protein